MALQNNFHKRESCREAWVQTQPIQFPGHERFLPLNVHGYPSWGLGPKLSSVLWALEFHNCLEGFTVVIPLTDRVHQCHFYVATSCHSPTESTVLSNATCIPPPS